MGEMADMHDYGYWPDDEEPHEITCKYCGKAGLEWDDSSGRWVLINEVGLPHKCNPAVLRARVRDEFEDLDDA
jgi:hypothetical protein